MALLPQHKVYPGATQISTCSTAPSLVSGPLEEASSTGGLLG